MAVFLATSAPAEVRRLSVLVVPTEESAERQALELERALTDLLATEPRLSLVDPAERYAAQAKEHSARQLASGRAALEAVRAAVGRLEYPEARTLAEAALANLRDTDFRMLGGVLLDLLIQLAAIKHALQVDDHGTAELTQALIIDPKLAAPRAWNSQEKAWFARTKQSVAAARPSAIRLEHQGAPGWVWVDGELAGLTPLTVSELRPGRHYFTFRGPGVEEQRSELIGELERLPFAPADSVEGRTYCSLRAALATGFRRGEPGAAALELLSWSQADELLAVAVGGTTGARVLRVGAGGQVPSTETAIASPQAVAEVVKRVLDRPLEPAQAPAQVKTQGDVHQGSPAAPSTVNPRVVTGWVMVALAAAAVVAGTVLILDGDRSYAAANQQIAQPDDVIYVPAVDRASALRGAGIGALGGAGLLGGVGLVLLW